MRMLAAAIAIAPATLSAEGYSGHEGVEIFTRQPCSELIDLLDSNLPDFPENADSATQTAYWRSVGDWSAQVGMAWGFILGYDTAKGGLSEGEETTLYRLRNQCENRPELPAIILLDGMTFG